MYHIEITKQTSYPVDLNVIYTKGILKYFQIKLLYNSDFDSIMITMLWVKFGRSSQLILDFKLIIYFLLNFIYMILLMRE